MTATTNPALDAGSRPPCDGPTKEPPVRPTALTSIFYAIIFEAALEGAEVQQSVALRSTRPSEESMQAA
jgi:hypothetical protein